MLLSIIGVGLTNAAERMSHWYWVAMVPVFFSACLFIEWKGSREEGTSVIDLLLKQLQNWLGLLAAIYMTFILREMGSLNNETTGLVLLMLFALTTFLVGVTMGWLFRLLGIFLGICLIAVAYLELYLWIIIAVSFVLLLLYHFLVRWLGPVKHG